MNAMLILLTAALPVLAMAQSQTAWRCGAEGRSYSDTRCADGRSVELASARPEADVQAAREIALREGRLADRLQRERLQREKIAPGAGLAGIGYAPNVRTAAAQPAPRIRRAKSKRLADGDISRAVAPASRQTRG